MTPQRAKELLPIIQAFAEGKDIQCKYRGDATWTPCPAPGWTEACEYRVKPEKKKGWVNIYRRLDGGGGTLSGSIFHTKHAADAVVGRADRFACIEIEYEEGQGL